MRLHLKLAYALTGLLLPAALAVAPTTPPTTEPAPTPEPAVVSVPQPQTKPTASAAPAALTILLETTLPALIDGKKTTIPYKRTLVVSSNRMASLRKNAAISPRLDGELSNFIKVNSSPAKDARFEVLWDNSWGVVQHNSVQGNLAQTRQAVLQAIKTPGSSTVRVVLGQSISPKRTLDYFLSKGITQLLATGETNYYGSSAARIKNIHVGISHFQDRLMSDKVFSFNKMVGPIELTTGFVTGLVISGERTADGVGGGICQVSSTVFRALYGAGLPLVERRNHSYQVHYYNPQGLDATVYQPTQDLKFTNDTGGALWFQAEWNDAEARLTAHVFGKPRDFTVSIDKPKVLSTTPSPVDKFLPDETIKVLGQKKQVDWAAPGAIIEVTRNFIRDGKVFKQDVLKSNYKPWPNIYLVYKAPTPASHPTNNATGRPTNTTTTRPNTNNPLNLPSVTPVR